MTEKDVLGKALLSMRDSLHQFDKENKQRAKIAQGIAQFAEILRKSNDDFKILGRQIVSKLAKDLEINLVGFYLIDEGDEFIELVASYGFDEKRLGVNRIEKGNGLVGQSMVSKEAIYLSPVPKTYYAKISSGLGQSTPAALLITPLKHNGLVLGAIEIASFSIIEDYQRAFVEKIAESIASTIAALKTNERNKQLLQEYQKHANVDSKRKENLYQ